MKNGGVSKQLKKLTISAMFTALGVIFNCAGSVIEVLDITCAFISSIFVLLALHEFGSFYPWLIYIATGLLSVIIFPQGVASWVFVAYIGYYPMLKKTCEKLSSPIAWLIKILSLNIALAIAVVILNFVFFGFGSFKTIPEAFYKIFGDPMFGKWFAYLFYASVNFVFVLYDIALTRTIKIYNLKLRDKMKFLR